MTTAEAAAALDIDTRTVSRQCGLGRFPGAVLVNAPRGPVWDIPPAAVDAYRATRLGQLGKYARKRRENFKETRPETP